MTKKADKGKKQKSLDFESAVIDAINSLPDQIQRVYKLHRKEGLSLEEIALIMDMHSDIVELHISEALKLLEKNLQHFSNSKD